MKRIVLISSVAALALILLAPSAWAAELTSRNEAQVTVRDVVVRDGTVSGVVVNNSGLPVRNPRVLIRQTWLWENEFKPGSNNPGRSEIVTVSAEIAPGDSFNFTRQLRTPPIVDQRGRFQTSGEIVGFEQIGLPEISGTR